MSIIKSIKKRFANQFVSVIVEDNECKISCKVFKNNELIFSDNVSFIMKNKNELSNDGIEYFLSLQENNKNTYIILYANSLGQGAIAECNKNKFKKYNVNIDNVQSLTINNQFSIYISNIDLQWFKKIFEAPGIDFLYSPFLLLNHLYKKEEKDSRVKMIILNNLDTFAVSYMNGDKLLFSSFFNIEKEENLLFSDFEEIEDDKKNDEFEDNINLDDEETEFEELEEIIEDEEFLTLDLNEDNDFQELDNKPKLLFFDKDARFIKYLNLSLKEFYSNSLYKSNFVENAKIYDAGKLNMEIIDYIKNELFIDIEYQKVNLHDEMIKIAKKEIFN